MSEPLTSEERERLLNWTATDPSVVRRNLYRRLLTDLDALEKRNGQLDKQRMLFLQKWTNVAVERDELLPIKAELDILRARCEQLQASLFVATLQTRTRSDEAWHRRCERLEEALRRNRQGYLNILEMRCEGYGGRYGALTREEIEEVIAAIDAALALSTTEPPGPGPNLDQVRAPGPNLGQLGEE